MHVPEEVIRKAVAHNWRPSRSTNFRYFPEGGGAYHWIALLHEQCTALVRHLRRPGHEALAGSRPRRDIRRLASRRRRSDGPTGRGLGFRRGSPSRAGRTLPAERVDDRHSALECSSTSTASRVNGGRPSPVASLTTLVTLLARLHERTPAARRIARRGLDVPGRDDLDDALNQLDRPWDAGPLSEVARHELGHARRRSRRLADQPRSVRGGCRIRTPSWS